MTSTLKPLADSAARFEDQQTPAKHHPDRWNLHRAGIVNVWHYYDTEFDLSGGRLVLRGTNGSGKSRALEMLLPFLFDADRRRMDATGSSKVQLADLMRAGSQDVSNRVGYLWVELRRRIDPDELTSQDAFDSLGGQDREGDRYTYLTLGAHLRFSRSTSEVKVHYFTTPLRVGYGLPLLSPTREPLSRDQLTELVGTDRITTAPPVHRDRVRSAVFGLNGEAAAERYDGLLQLLHTLRSPDVGNRIEEGRLPQILADALPPLSETALAAAGERLDSLSETRAAQDRIEGALEHVRTFLAIYRRYAAATLARSAEEAHDAAEANLKAEKTAQLLHATHADLEAQSSAADAALRELSEQLDEVEATIAGVKESKAYADARDLDERANRVGALGTAADTALARAHDALRSETRTVATADERAEEVAAAGDAAAAAIASTRQQLVTAHVPSGLVGSLPESLAVTVTDAPGTSTVVRRIRDADPESTPRPGPRTVTVTPEELDALAQRVAEVRTAVTQRAQQAEHRATEARRVAAAYRAVETAENTAAQKAQDAESAQREAVARGKDVTAVVETYVNEWGGWLTADAAVDAAAFDLAERDEGSDPTVDAAHEARVIVDQALANTGDLLAADAQTLARLDAAANRIVAPHRDLLTGQLTALDAADRKDRENVQQLRTEQRDLEAAVDPAPVAVPWHTVRADGAVPLWRAVEFLPDVPADTQAGLEGALLAAGLLTATIEPVGRLRADDGEVLLHPTSGAPSARAVTEVLRPDPNADLPAAVVDAILSRISLRGPAPQGQVGAPADTDGGLWVSGDGSWGAGPLTGRHQPATARHVGAAARAAGRAARLAEIAGEIATLQHEADERAHRRSELRVEQQRLDALVTRAPRTQPIATAHARAVDAEQRAEKADATAEAAQREAADRRRQWVADRDQHVQVCAELELPAAADELTRIHQDTRDAATACGKAISQLDELNRQLSAHDKALSRVSEASDAYDTALTTAEDEWGVWHREAATFEAVAATVGREAEEARRELAEAEQRHRQLRAERSETSNRREDLIRATTEAGVEARTAEAAIAGTIEARQSAAAMLVHRCALPGLADAAFTDKPDGLTLADDAPASVKALTTRILGALRDHANRSDEGTVARAQQTLERELSGDYDVHLEIEGGVRLISLSDAAGVRSVAAAADELTRSVEQGRKALTDRERQVFTEFVLGGVAEELRRRLGQAEELAAAMNASLGSIRTSHGIGVKLKWVLDDAADPEIARIRDLVSTAGEVRSMEQTEELTRLLKGRVDAAFAVDASAGYATHLNAALDYRAWHRMDVYILGPAPGQERRISRKAKLSQGETRFVSYVALFAAVDAYLSGLPDIGHALRILLLDDAFAKVDDRTIGELMGLLVRLDIDFVMTGHALWGTYPQVPQLDAYEIRRAGGAAVTTHVHWDGRNRHLRTTSR